MANLTDVPAVVPVPEAPMSFTGSEPRVLHLHPTIAPGIAVPAVAAAAHLGYTMLSVSGGEPLMHPGLWAVLDEARRGGLLRAIVTNGGALTGPIAARLRDAADIVAVSLDGRPDRHNDLRQHPPAFARMEQGLSALRAEGVPFKLLCAVSADSLADLPWMASYAAEQGASGIQIHPIEPAGRAALLPPADTALKAYLIAERLRQLWGGRLRIDIDVADLLPFACDDDARQACGSIAVDDLSAAVSPLVIEPDGDVVPLRYGFSPAFAIGNLYDAPLETLARTWLALRARSFLALAREALATAALGPCPFGNPYEIIANAASATAGAVVVGRRAS
jgi:MoaA/NifB/PqqE/SkfB family radical SAM enzyme